MGGDCGRRRCRERTERQAHALPAPVSWTRRARLMLACMIASRASGPGRPPPVAPGPVLPRPGGYGSAERIRIILLMFNNFVVKRRLEEWLSVQENAEAFYNYKHIIQTTTFKKPYVRVDGDTTYAGLISTTVEVSNGCNLFAKAMRWSCRAWTGIIQERLTQPHFHSGGTKGGRNKEGTIRT